MARARDLVARGMPLVQAMREAVGQVPHGPVGEDPRFVYLGRIDDSVDALLGLGQVADAPLDRQRAWVAHLWADPPLANILQPLKPELVRRGLI